MAACICTSSLKAGKAGFPAGQALLEGSLKFSPRTLLTHRSRLCLCACLFVSNHQEPTGKSPQAPSYRVSWLPWASCLLSWQQTQLQLPSQGARESNPEEPKHIQGGWGLGWRQRCSLSPIGLSAEATNLLLPLFESFLTPPNKLLLSGPEKTGCRPAHLPPPWALKRTRQRPGLNTGSASTWLCRFM